MSRWTQSLDALGENLGLKIVSLVIAVGLFAFKLVMNFMRAFREKEKSAENQNQVAA